MVRRRGATSYYIPLKKVHVLVEHFSMSSALWPLAQNRALNQLDLKSRSSLCRNWFLVLIFFQFLVIFLHCSVFFPLPLCKCQKVPCCTL